MTTFLFADHMFPFTVALGLLFGLMLLELVAALLGGSFMGVGADGDLDLDVDLDAGVDPGLDGDIDLDAMDAAEADSSLSGPSGWLGLGKVPFMIWLAAFLMSFGLGGFVVQTVATSLFGTGLPASVAGVAMVPVGLGFARQFSGVFARILPKSESSAVSENHLGRRRGVVSQGTATRGQPAEVRVVDGHGNTHYIRAEPMRDDVSIAQGTEVLVTRKSLSEGYRLIALPE